MLDIMLCNTFATYYVEIDVQLVGLIKSLIVPESPVAETTTAVSLIIKSNMKIN